MTDPSTLRRADSAEVADALAYALLYGGNRRVHHADGAMTRITADYLIRHLEQPTCYWPTRLPVSRGQPPPGLDRSERHAGDPPEIVEIWLTD